MSATTTLKMVLLGDASSAERALKGVGTEAETSGRKMQTFHKVGTAAGVALAGGLLLAGKAAIDMTKAAAQDQAGASKLAQTLRASAGATDAQVASTESWITAQGKALGVTDDELRPALSKLAIATGSVSKAQKLASLAMDIAAARGLSLSSVSQALAKAQTGNISGLSRLGIATKDASGKTLTLEQVTKKMAATYTGAAATAAQTTAGKQKILTTQMHELEEQIGYKLLPVMMKLVNVGLTVVNWISKNTTVVGILIGVLGSLLAITWAVSAATKAWAAITKIAAAGQWLLNAALDANPIGLVVIAIAALVVALVLAYRHSETFRRIVQAAFHGVQAAAAFAFNWIKGHWKLLLAIIGGPVVAAAILIISNWGRIKTATVAVWNAIKSVVKGAWSVIATIVRGEIDLILGFIRGAASRIMGLGGLFLNAGKSLIHSLFDGILAAARAGAGFVGDLVGAIKSAVNTSLGLPLRIDFDKGPVHIHSTVIPALAKGGIVNSPTLALIGEAGPEAVVPLSGRNAGGFGGGGGGDINVVVNASGLVDPQAMARQIRTELVKLKRTSFGGPTGSLGLA